jgi:hypothetical protein
MTDLSNNQFAEAIPHAKEYLGDETTQLFLNQLLLAFVIKQGGTVKIEASEVDLTGGWIMTMHVDQSTKTFILEAKEKQ